MYLLAVLLLVAVVVGIVSGYTYMLRLRWHVTDYLYALRKSWQRRLSVLQRLEQHSAVPPDFLMWLRAAIPDYREVAKGRRWHRCLSLDNELQPQYRHWLQHLLTRPLHPEVLELLQQLQRLEEEFTPLKHRYNRAVHDYNLTLFFLPNRLLAVFVPLRPLPMFEL